jgi:hypothetical protein
MYIVAMAGGFSGIMHVEEPDAVRFCEAHLLIRVK